MSELKAFNCVESDLQEFCEPRLVYLKSEADKVIADLEESHKKEVGQLLMDIAELKETLNNSRNARKYWRKEYLIEYKECSYQKYKRCLAMAKWCRLEQERIELIECQDITDDDFDKLVKGFYTKWHKRWLAIAEKYKTNSTINRKEATNAL